MCVRFLGTKLLCQKLLKTSLLELKIPRFKVKAVWIISALTMPALVLLIAILLGGHWEINTFNSTDRNATITGAIFFYGLATGIVEELIFRGIIMGCLEKRFNIQIAVIVAVASAYSFSNSSRDLSIVFDLLLGKTKDRLPAVSGKRSRVTVFGFSLAGKVQTQSGCTFPARAQG